jgi:APA family basic amino acid/polyamine antiporter
MARAAGPISRLFRTKSLDQILADAERPETKLRRALGPFQLTLMGIGAIIGAGIFATVGTAAAGDANRPGAGPALSLSFVITAVVCGFTALCYAEFASMVPISGSAYTYSYSTLGEVVAWIIGWDLIIEYAVGNIAVAISWANYFKTFVKGFGIVIPDWLSMDYRTAARIVDAAGVATVYRDAPRIFGVPIILNIVAVGIVGAITAILIWGIRESARFNAVMVGIKIVVLTFFIAAGSFWVRPENWTPFAPNGWAGISAGAAIVFFAYIGFDAVSTVAEEAREPQRTLPIGILASLVVCTAFYAVVSAVFTGLISFPDLKAKLATEQAEPLTMALEHASSHLGWAVGIVAFGSVVAHTAVLLVFQLGQTRIFFSMARDGLLPSAFRRVHPRFRTPHLSTLLTGAFVGVFAAVASLDEMVDLTNIGTLFAFILVCAGTIVLRRRDPDRARPFRVPSGWGWTAALYAGFAVGVWLLPIPGGVRVALLLAGAALFAASRRHIFPVLGILSCLYLVYYLPPTSWLRFAAWLNFGFVVYLGYGSTHSRLTGRDRAAEGEARHDLQTAFAGALMALAGTAMLFLTRGLDLYLLGYARHADLAGGARAAAAAGELLRGAPWIEVSWFLIVPLAVNGLYLCPLVVRRALRSRRFGGWRDARVLPAFTMASVAAVGLGTVVYLATVGARSLP